MCNTFKKKQYCAKQLQPFVNAYLLLVQFFILKHLETNNLFLYYIPFPILFFFSMLLQLLSYSYTGFGTQNNSRFIHCAPGISMSNQSISVFHQKKTVKFKVTRKQLEKLFFSSNSIILIFFFFSLLTNLIQMDRLFSWINLELCVLISIELHFSFLFLSTFRLTSDLTIFLL